MTDEKQATEEKAIPKKRSKEIVATTSKTCLDWGTLGKEIEEALGLEDAKLDWAGINWAKTARILYKIIQPAIAEFLRERN